MDKTKMLAQVPLFAHLDKRALAQLATMVDEVDVDAGTVLMTEGRSGREFFVIVEGTVDVTRGGRHLRSLVAGDFLGEIACSTTGRGQPQPRRRAPAGSWSSPTGSSTP